MHIAHHSIFVALSVLTAWLGSWTALDLFRRVPAHVGAWRLAWLAASGIAMGLSIWSMHFIAMLGFDPGAEVRYDVTLTVLSLLLAIAATTFAFFSAREYRPYRQLASGVFMGAGICGMHYVGMAALITEVGLANDPLYVVLAFVVAVSASTGALLVAMRKTTLPQRIAAAMVLGFAIVGMHYTGMFGVRILPVVRQSVDSGGMDPFVLASSVAAGTLLILLLALIAAMSDRKFEAMAVREALRSERQLRAILDNLPIGVFVAGSPSGEIRFANAEAERLLGHPLGGSPLWAHEGIHGAIDQAGRRLGPEEHVLYKAMHENRRVGPQLQNYRRTDGELIQLEVTAAPVSERSNGGSFSVAAFQDVTAKLLAEEQARLAMTLRESEERFRLIAEQAPVMLWMSDAEGRPIYLNKTLRDFHGVTEPRDGVDWTTSIADEDRPGFMERLHDALRTHQGFSMQATLQRVDRARRFVHILARPRFGKQNEFLGLIGVDTDVTEARQAEQSLKGINELLEQRVAVALAEKAEAEAALMHAQRLESLGRLTGGVAHDFNNLLTVVIGTLDIILRHPENAARRKRLGEAALAAARRGERLTAQLLAFARRQPLQPKSCDLNALIRESEPLLKRATGERISLKLHLCQEKAVALIDPAQFEASLLNLIVNAVDASEEGGEICVQTELRVVSVEELPGMAPGHYVRMSVSDRGQGMRPEIMSHIFEPFFTTKGAGKGTGLGLSQVYGFVRQSGGEVRAHSTLGTGTRFDVYLPACAAEVEASETRELAPLTPVGSLSILLAEDDSSVAGITEAMLGNLGHEVIRTVNAEQALQIVRSGARIDVLFTDVIMPGGMNGVELAEEAARARPDLKILLCSGYTGESLDRSVAQGAWPFLKKPYLEAELADTLAQLVTEPSPGAKKKVATH